MNSEEIEEVIESENELNSCLQIFDKKELLNNIEELNVKLENINSSIENNINEVLSSSGLKEAGFQNLIKNIKNKKIKLVINAENLKFMMNNIYAGLKNNLNQECTVLVISDANNTCPPCMMQLEILEEYDLESYLATKNMYLVLIKEFATFEKDPNGILLSFLKHNLKIIHIPTWLKAMNNNLLISKGVFNYIELNDILALK